MVRAFFISILFLSSSLAFARSKANAYEFTVNFALFPGAGWNRELIEKHVADARRVFAQCQIQRINFNVYEVTDFQLPADLQGRNVYAPNGIATIRIQSPQVPQPVVYLVNGLSDSGAMTKAIFTINAPPCEAELVNTIWIPSEVNTPEWAAERSKSPYSVLAHELTHLLTLEGQHNGDIPRNELSVWRVRTDYLTDQMCDQIRRNVFVKPITRSRANRTSR